MKILHVNTSDIQGGAARAAYRLHRALLNENVDSQMLVQNKISDDYTVIGSNTKIQKGLDKIRPTLDSVIVCTYKNRTPTLFSPSWLPFSGIIQRINELNPDIVHLHWICGGMLRIEDIAKIKAPIVWSLHDMWAFTGGCHYNDHCDNYKQHCGQCKVLNTSNSSDLSRKILKRKQNSYDKIKKSLTIIGLSRWMADCASKSILFQGANIINLPNPIDTKTFSPIERHNARTLLNLPQDKKFILFGAMNATADSRKGFKELSQALQKLPADYELIVFGSSKPKQAQGFKQQAHYLGHLHDDISLRLLYSAVDVMVVPSLQENLSNAIMENLACATPVVAFAVGGNADLVDHQANGYLAQPFSPEDLSKGIEWVINSKDYEKLCQNARQKVLACFDSHLVYKRYIELYHQILSTT